ncbi:MAG: FecR domain-containing protein [Azospirillaceae bacterium]
MAGYGMRWAIAGGAALLAGLAGPVPASADAVGVTSAVNPATTGTPPDGPTRALYLGDEVVFNETIETGSDGRAQVLLLDQSAFTVGPGARMVLDEFVYDPDASTGRLTASISQGVFRFVGGALSKNEGAVTINTPSATVGVRGGIVTIAVEAGGATRVYNAFGDHTVTLPDGTVERLFEPGYGVTVGLDGGSIAPRRADPDSLLRSIQAFTGAVPELPDGSAPGEAIDQVFERANIVRLGSGEAPDALSTVSGGSGGESPGEPGDVASGIKNASVDSALAGLLFPQPGTPDPGTPIPGTIARFASSGELYRTARGELLAEPGTLGLLGSGATADRDLIRTATRIALDGDRLIVDFAGGGRIVLPYRVGAFPVDGAAAVNLGGTSVPLTGSAFVAPGSAFFAYNLFLGGDADRPLLLQGGRPFDATAAGRAADGSLRLYALSPDAREGSALPMTNADLYGLDDDGVTAGPVLVLEPESGVLGGGADGEATVLLQAAVKLDGTGPGQVSAITLLATEFGLLGGDAPVAEGARLGGVRRLASDRLPVSYSGTVATVRAGDAALFGGDGGYFVLGDDPADTAEFRDSEGFGRASATRPFNAGATVPSTRHVASLTGTAGRAGLERTLDRVDGGTGDLQGYTAFLLETDSADAVAAAAGGHAFAGDAVNPTAPIVYRTLRTVDVTVADPGAEFLTLDFGTRRGNRLAARLDLEDARDEDTIARRLFAFGPGGGQAAGSAYVDDDRYATTENTALTRFFADGAPGRAIADDDGPGSYLLSGDLAGGVPFLPPGVTECACDFLEWGYWGGSSSYRDPVLAADRLDVMHLEPWVAGRLPDPADLPTTGIGRWSGHAVGDIARVIDGVQQRYLTGGDFSMFWDFRFRSGQARIDDFDGDIDLLYNIPGSDSANGRDFQIPLDASLPGDGQLRGSFFTDGVDPAAGVAGDFHADAPDYRAAGIFMGERD